MMLDAQNLFSDKQAITGAAVSTNYINLGQPDTVPRAPAPLKRDIGGGYNIPLAIVVAETFNNLTSLQVDVEISDTADFASVEIAGSTGPVPADRLNGGYLMPLAVVPPGTDRQYMRLRYTTAGTAPTTGRITAGISAGLQTNG